MPIQAIRSDLEGQVCLVTGGANGIGLATARALSALGASVCILDLDASAATAAAASVAELNGVPSLGLQASVTDERAVRDAVAHCRSVLGPVDILVNNAGILTRHVANFADIEIADIEEMQRVHVTGAAIVTRALINDMLERRYGRVVNVSSVLGLLGAPRRIGYAIAKHAIIGFTRALAVEVARSGVTVNAVAPGYVLTEHVRDRMQAGLLDYAAHAERAPAGRWALPEEIAHAIAFLALPASGFITGVVLPVDGGYSIRGDAGDNLGPIQELASLDALRGEIL